MRVYRIENIKLKPLLVLGRDHDDAADILADALRTGMGDRPDADFDVVYLNPTEMDRPPPELWISGDDRGIIWPVGDDPEGWQMKLMNLDEP